MGTLFKEYIIEKIIEYLEKPKKNIYFMDGVYDIECRKCQSVAYCHVDGECPWAYCSDCNLSTCDQCIISENPYRCIETENDDNSINNPIICRQCIQDNILYSHFIESHKGVCICEHCIDINEHEFNHEETLFKCVEERCNWEHDNTKV